MYVQDTDDIRDTWLAHPARPRSHASVWEWMAPDEFLSRLPPPGLASSHVSQDLAVLKAALAALKQNKPAAP